MDEIKVRDGDYGSKFFSVSVEYHLDIRSIVKCFLYYTATDGSNPRWTGWDREKTLQMMEVLLRQVGLNAVDDSKKLPGLQRLHGYMALRFAEELFPELVYDYQECDRQVQAFIENGFQDS